MNVIFRLFLLLTLLSLTACAAPRFDAGTPLASDLDLITRVDEVSADADCRNAAYHTVPGFPYLRTTRFWQSLADEQMSGEQFSFWLDIQRRHDREARTSELSCLDEKQRLALVTTAGRAHGITGLGQQLERSAANLVEQDKQNRKEVLADVANSKVPDDYSIWLRIFGIYPISRLPILYGVYDAYDERYEWFERDVSELVEMEKVVDIGPQGATTLATADISKILQEAGNNPLSVPLPNETQSLQLIEHFAPRFRQEVKLAADHWGAVSLDGGDVVIKPERVVYYYLDHQVVKGQALLRLNYVIWHPARDGDVVPWFERGNLEGVTYAVVLMPNGAPLIASTMNNCGCYLQFFPDAARIEGVIDKPWNPDVLAPQKLPEINPGERATVTMTSGWHQVVRLESDNREPDETYRLEPYTSLEQLPHDSGRSRSLFDLDGVLPDTERAERFFFYGMGIPSVGSMRQRGHQPTTLLGREHYDDPDLIESNFKLSDKGLK